MRYLVIIFLFTINSCSAINIPVVQSIDSIRIISIEGNTVNLESVVSLENTNSFSISGKELEFKLFYQNSLIGTGSSLDDFELKSKSSNQLKTNMFFYLDSIPESLRMTLFQLDSIPINMNVSFQGKLGIKHQHNSEFKVPMSQLQDALLSSFIGSSNINLTDLKLESATQTQSKFAGMLVFNNSLPMDFEFVNSDVFIYPSISSKVKIGDVEMQDSIFIKRGSEAKIECKMNVDNLKAMSSGFGKILTGVLDYYAIGPVLIMFQDKEYKLPLLLHFSYNPISGKILILD